MTKDNFFCNPNAMTDGTGSKFNPYKTYTGKALNYDDAIYWIFADSAHDGEITITGTKSALQKYGNGEHPKILPNGASKTIKIGTGGKGEGAGTSLIGLDIYGGNSNGQEANRAISIGYRAAPADNVKIHDCLVHEVMNRSQSTSYDHNAINVYGNNFLCQDTEIFNVLEDAIWVNGLSATANATLRRVRVHDVDLGGRRLGDCAQFVDVPNLLVEDCFFDHRNAASKQCLVINQTLGGIGGLIRNTVMAMAVGNGSNCLYSNQAGLRVQRSYLIGGDHGANLAGANQLIEACLIVGAGIGVVSPSSSGVSPTLRQSTIANCQKYGADLDTAVATIVGNLFVGNATGLRRLATSANWRNAYWKNLTDSAWRGAAGAEEADALKKDPLLFYDFRPRAGSPLIQASDPAMLASVGLDLLGRPYQNPPTIGALEFNPEAVAMPDPTGLPLLAYLQAIGLGPDMRRTIFERFR